MSRGTSRTVLIVNPGADLYGSDRMVLETARGLVRSGYRVVVAVANDGPLVPLLVDVGAEVEVVPTPVVRKGLMNPRGLLSLARDTVKALRPHLRVLNRIDPAVVIVNTITPPLWLPLSRLNRRYTVCHVHEGEGSIAPTLRRLLYLPVAFSHRVIINSAFSAKVLATAAPWLTRRTRVVYNTVAGPEQARPPRPRLGEPVRILFVGRLSQRKGPQVAIEALSLLRRAGIDAHLTLRGAVFPGNEVFENRLHDLVQAEDLMSAVHFAGFAPSVWDDLAEADIAVIPSTVDEPFGNTAVEAALAARPAVISRVGGLPEAAAHSTSAVLVPPDDAAAMADALRRIVEAWPEFRERAIRDATEVARAFSREGYVEGVLTEFPRRAR